MIFKEHSHVSTSTSQSPTGDQKTKTSTGSLDAADADCSDYSVITIDEKFELLSAYLDDEVTADEKCLVEHWLSSDLEVKAHYEKQLRLKAAIKAFFTE